MALLRRAVSVLRPRGSRRNQILCELGITLFAAGEHESALEALEDATADATFTEDRVTAARARMELEYIRLPRTTGATAAALLETTEDAIRVLESAGEPRLLGRALLLNGWIHGGRRGEHKLREQAAERALELYKSSSWPISTCAGEIANALYYGPTPVADAIARCDSLVRDEAPNRYGRANIGVFLGGLVAQRGDFTVARELISAARVTYNELGHRTSVVTHSAAILGDVELLAGDATAAEETFRWTCEELTRAQAYSHLASRAGDLAEALYRRGAYDEAAEWVAKGQLHSASDDIDARLLWMPVEAKLAAQRGDVEDALGIISAAATLAEGTDGLNRRAAVQMDIGEILRIAGQRRDAGIAVEQAIELFERKGNTVGARRAQSLPAARVPA